MSKAEIIKQAARARHDEYFTEALRDPMLPLAQRATNGWRTHTWTNDATRKGRRALERSIAKQLKKAGAI